MNSFVFCDVAQSDVALKMEITCQNWRLLNIVHSDRKPFGIVLTKIATDTGNFTVH